MNNNKQIKHNYGREERRNKMDDKKERDKKENKIT
jgi:hypothetical protein